MSQSESQEELYPLAVLIEELRNEDIRFRLHSIQKLSTIALALGLEKTRTQLIPFLTESIYDVDEVMVAIAEKLGDFVAYVGGVAHAPVLIAPLESLALVEDANVREKAVQSLRKLAREHNDRDLQEHIFPLIQRLATGDWYSSRASACGLFAVVYPRVNASTKTAILELAQTLAADDTPMVRRALSVVLGELALAMVGQTPDTDNASSQEVDRLLSESQAEGNEAPDFVVGSGKDSEKDNEEGVEDEDLEKLDDKNRSHAPPPPVLKETPELAESRAQIVATLLPIFNTLTYDDQEQVRILALESIIPIARALGPVESERELIPAILKAIAFKSWRARCLLANKMSDLQAAVGLDVTTRCLLDVFISLLTDEMAEVRSAAASQIKGFTSGLLNCLSTSITSSNTSATASDTAAETSKLEDDKKKKKNKKEEKDGGDLQGYSDVETTTTTKRSSNGEELDLLDSFVIQRLIPAMIDLNADSNMHVKSKLGLAIVGLAPLVGKDITINHLLPIILSQLKDDSPDVRLNLISNLEEVNRVIGIDQLSTNLLPAIVELAKVPVWRIRLAVINHMPVLADQLGEACFGERLMQHFLGWLVDAAYAVREAAVLNLTRLTAKFGSAWAKQFFLSEIVQLSHNENYLHRMISLQCIIHLSPVIDAVTCRDTLLPTALLMDHDRVPNVRFKVAQALAKVGACVSSDALSSEVMPCLHKLISDSDTDVRFYAHEAIDVLKCPSATVSSISTDQPPAAAVTTVDTNME